MWPWCLGSSPSLLIKPEYTHSAMPPAGKNTNIWSLQTEALLQQSQFTGCSGFSSFLLFKYKGGGSGQAKEGSVPVGRLPGLAKCPLLLPLLPSMSKWSVAGCSSSGGRWTRGRWIMSLLAPLSLLWDARASQNVPATTLLPWTSQCLVTGLAAARDLTWQWVGRGSRRRYSHQPLIVVSLVEGGVWGGCSTKPSSLWIGTDPRWRNFLP